jgi:hypothetical protein
MDVETLDLVRDLIESAYHVAATAAVVVAGVWAYRHYLRERPFEPNLTLDLSASAARLPLGPILVHFELRYTNTGRSHFETTQSVRRGQADPARSFFKVFMFSSAGIAASMEVPSSVRWDRPPPGAVLVHDGWFPDTPSIIQEPAETEVASLDLLLPTDAGVVSAWAKIHEDREGGYFWSISRVFVVEQLLAHR